MRHSKTKKKSKKRSAKIHPTGDSDSENRKCVKSGPLSNRLQEEATRVHKEYLLQLETLADEHEVDVHQVKQYLALQVAFNRRPNRYNVFLHAQSIDDPAEKNGTFDPHCYPMLAWIDKLQRGSKRMASTPTIKVSFRMPKMTVLVKPKFMNFLLLTMSVMNRTGWMLQRTLRIRITTSES